jgi:hypothetical protein
MAIKKDDGTHEKKNRIYLYMAIKKADVAQGKNCLLEHYSIFLAHNKSQKVNTHTHTHTHTLTTGTSLVTLSVANILHRGDY